MKRRRRARGRHLRPYDYEDEIKEAIVEQAKHRILGHYSGTLSNGDEYDVEIDTLDDFEMGIDMDITVVSGWSK